MLKYQVALSGDKDLSPSTAAASLALEGWWDLEQLCRHHAGFHGGCQRTKLASVDEAIWLERG